MFVGSLQTTTVHSGRMPVSPSVLPPVSAILTSLTISLTIWQTKKCLPKKFCNRKNVCQQKIGRKFFCDQYFFWANKFCCPKFFVGITFFWSTFILDQHLFWLNNFFYTNFFKWKLFWVQNKFSGTKFCVIIFFVGVIFFLANMFCRLKKLWAALIFRPNFFWKTKCWP